MAAIHDKSNYQRLFEFETFYFDKLLQSCRSYISFNRYSRTGGLQLYVHHLALIFHCNHLGQMGNAIFSKNKKQYIGAAEGY